MKSYADRIKLVHNETCKTNKAAIKDLKYWLSYIKMKLCDGVPLW